MAKKRRITTDQARLLAIRYIQRALVNETIHSEESTPSQYGWAVEYCSATLPEKWMDNQTSDQSWEHVWQETRIEIQKIVECLDQEAKSVQAANPEFRYPV